MSTTTLAVYDRISDPMIAVKQLGGAIAGSGMFGSLSQAQGEVFALECMVRKTPPLMLAEQYHVIFNKLSMKSDAMLAKFAELGGTHRIIARSPDVAGIELTFGGQTIPFTLTWEEAQAEPFPYDGKEAEIIKKLAEGKKPPLKAKYATPRSRGQMLWARVVSDSVRAMCPQVNNGRYTPEELGGEDDEAEAGGNGNGAAPAKQPRRKAADVVKAAATEVEPAKAAKDGEVIDGEFTVVADKQQPLPAGTTEPQYASSSQLLKIEELLEKLGTTPEGREKILAKRKVNSFRSLTIAQADELITGAAKMLVDAKAKAAATAAAAKAAAELPPAGPCSVEQQTEAKRRLTELKQVNPPAFGNFVGWLKSKDLKIEQLSARDCDRLIAAANDIKQMDDFFKVNLETWQPAAEPESSAPKTKEEERDDAEVQIATFKRESDEKPPF